MRTRNEQSTRQRITVILLKLLAVCFGLTTLPFLGEGFENLVLEGLQLWSFECFAIALIPGSIAYGLWLRRVWARTVALWIGVPAIPLLPVLIILAEVFAMSADVMTFVVASFAGLFAASIVYLLTRPEAKALFGIERVSE